MDANEAELLERRVAEQAEARVRRRLLWPVTVVVAVLGFFGYDLITDTRRAAEDAAERSVRESVSAARRSVEPAVERAERVAEEAAAQVEVSRRMLDLIEEWMDQRRRKLVEMEDEIAVRSEEVEQEARAMGEQLSDIGRRIGETEQEIEAQRARAEGLYAGAGNLADLAEQVKALAEQVKALDRQLVRLAEAGPQAAPELEAEVVARSQAIESIASAAQRIGPSAAGSAETQRRVFIHFSSADRALMDGLSRALSDEGWSVPEAQRVKAVPERPEVRYYFEADRQAAEQLGAAAGDWLQARGFEGRIEVRDFSDYRGAKPRPGVMELWIDPQRG